MTDGCITCWSIDDKFGGRRASRSYVAGCSSKRSPAKRERAMRASAPRWGLVSGGPDGISSVMARGFNGGRRLDFEQTILVVDRNDRRKLLRARIDGIAGRHLVMLLRKSIGIDLASLDLLRRDILTQSESRDRFSIELEQPIDIFAAIEVGPPLRLCFPPVISQEAAQ